jgi:dipeptidyl aminopeptidase/acylaminoacyl peptidase
MEAKHLPTIMLPHGGPGARDSADWDYEAQFYASRGYAVLKPNFRGSTGYGAKFRLKGEKQWGGLMQQDVTDATRWLISQGIADPERICIVGSSYGGYAAMMGLIQEPSLYACGISMNGIMNIPALKTQNLRLIGGRDWTEEMGLEGAKDTDVSPQQQALRIKDPVLLIAATNDARVPYEQTRKMHRALKRLKKDTTYVEINTGTHYMVNAASRLAMLSAAEKFLAKHLQ